MAFDAKYYEYLSATDAAAAAAYLSEQSAPAAAPTPPPAAPAAPPAAAPAAQPQAQGAFYNQAQAQNLAQPQQVAARGTLEDFYNQPVGGGGKSVTSQFFNKRPQGSWLQLQVIADAGNQDVQHQKTPQGVLQYFKTNGQDDLTKPKLVLVVKVLVVGSSDGSHTAEFPDGQATVWVKGPLAQELRRAMSVAGDDSGYPKANASIVMQSAGEQASRVQGYSPTKLYKLEYAPGAAVDPTPTVDSASSAVPAATVPTPAAAPVAASVPAAAPISTPAPATVPGSVPTPPPAAGDDAKAALLSRLKGASS